MWRKAFDFEDCREAYREFVHRLLKEAVDVFVGNHIWNNNIYEYGKLLLETGENRFLDSTLWQRFLQFCEECLDKVIEQDP